MQSFFVLGLIPGTNIQINFFVWLSFFIVLAITAIALVLNYRRQIAALARIASLRKPLPANQLHTRLQ